MKKLFGNVKYKIDGEVAEIHAVAKDTKKLELFGTCHIASIPYLKENWSRYGYLVKVLPNGRNKSKENAFTHYRIIGAHQQ
jgi:hypothetical protein